MKKTAIIFGATGLVGESLTNQIVKEEKYSKIILFNRRPVQLKLPKIIEHIVDFSDLSSFSELFEEADVFCCLGTTIKKAGSQDKFREIDLELPVDLAMIAKDKGSKHFSVVSSLGANPKSSTFYLRTKGQMENSLMRLQFLSLSIMRPSILLGDRKERRLGEKVGKVVMKFLHPFLIGKFKKYRGILASDVARRMIKIAIEPAPGVLIIESDKI